MISKKDEQWESLYLFAKHLLDEHTSFSDIETHLSKKTEDAVLVAEIIKQLKQVHYAIKRRSGMVKLGIAGFFLLVGFLITCVNFHSNQSFTIVMYSFTTIGLSFLFYGLYEIIG